MNILKKFIKEIIKNTYSTKTTTRKNKPNDYTIEIKSTPSERNIIQKNLNDYRKKNNEVIMYGFTIVEKPLLDIFCIHVKLRTTSIPIQDIFEDWDD